MAQNRKRRPNARLAALACLICWLSACVPAAAAAVGGQDAVASEQACCEYYLHGQLPAFRRTVPLAEDDPLLAEGIPADAEIPYRYGSVYRDVDDASPRPEEGIRESGSGPTEDRSLLVGGNAASAANDLRLDADTDDFPNILPCASLFVLSDALSFSLGRIEYSFYTEDFHYNDYSLYDHTNIRVKETVAETSRYQRLFPDAGTLPSTGEPCSENWCGVAYTGGIRKTTLDENGNCTETCVRGCDDRGLFSVRYKNAVQDRTGRTFDLVLTFLQIDFVAEADVTGALQIMEGCSLFLAPIVYENGRYTVNLDGDSAPSANPFESEGVRIGARYTFSYSVEDASGKPADGILLYAARDLDSPSMAAALETDAAWGLREDGQDYRWAEGLGIVSGAASAAVTPYCNHGAGSGETSPLLHISRMRDVPADGTANGLMFSAGNTLPFARGGRNDGDTFDTGFAALLYPRGSMVASLSADRRDAVEMALFFPGPSGSILQTASPGGSIFSPVYSLLDGSTVEYRDKIKPVWYGSASEHLIRPDKGYVVQNLVIDGQTIPYHRLHWQALADGSAQASWEITEKYGSKRTVRLYTFLRDADGTLHVTFPDVSENHMLRVFFIKRILALPARITIRRRYLLLFAAGFCALVFCADVLWLLKKRRA